MILSSLFFFVLALIIALLEIEIEGPNGWAKKLPTWYRINGYPARIYAVIMGGRPLTGYHLFMFVLPLMFLHSGFFLGVAWTLEKEIVVWALYLSWAPLWDFLWFVMNPNYGVKKFKKINIWWHSKTKWVFGLFPLDYLIGWAISLLLISFNGTESLRAHAYRLSLFLVFTVITIILSPLYHKWRRKMERRDDRNLLM